MEPQDRRRTVKWGALVAASAVLAAAACLLLWGIMSGGREAGTSVSAMPGMSMEEIQASLDEQVREPMMTVAVSPVPVRLASAETSGMPSYGSYTLSDSSGDAVHSCSGGTDRDGAELEIGIGASAPLNWSVGDILGEEAQELLYAALRGQTPVCDVLFTIEEA